MEKTVCIIIGAFVVAIIAIVIAYWHKMFRPNDWRIIYIDYTRWITEYWHTDRKDAEYTTFIVVYSSSRRKYKVAIEGFQSWDKKKNKSTAAYRRCLDKISSMQN
jgi:hypothetical protein